MSRPIKLLFALHATRVTRKAMTLIELVIVIGLIMGIGTLGVLSSVRFWHNYQLDQSETALRRFFQQMEIVGTLTQADLQLSFVSSSDGIRLELKGCTPIAVPKFTAQIELSRIERVDLFLEGERIDPCIVWSSSEPPSTLRVHLVAGKASRDVSYLSSWRPIALSFSSISYPRTTLCSKELFSSALQSSRQPFSQSFSLLDSRLSLYLALAKGPDSAYLEQGRKR